MSSKQMPEEVKPKEIKKEKTFGEMFDFNNMFRVKGKQGLVSVISHTQGCKMAIVCDIYTKGRRAVSVDKMIRLGDCKFATTDVVKVNTKPNVRLESGVEYNEEDWLSEQKVLNMTDVFNNLMNYATTSEDYGFEKVSVEDLMPIMVPNYDNSLFRIKKATQLLGWYIEVTLKYSALIDKKVEDGEVQLLTEEKED